MNLKELLGEIKLEGTVETDTYFDPDDNTIRVRVIGYSKSSPRRYGFEIKINPYEMPSLEECESLPVVELTVEEKTTKDNSTVCHRCNKNLVTATRVDYDWYKHTYDDCGEKIGEKRHWHYRCSNCGVAWCELGNPISDGYIRVFVDEKFNYVIKQNDGE